MTVNSLNRNFLFYTITRENRETRDFKFSRLSDRLFESNMMAFVDYRPNLTSRRYISDIVPQLATGGAVIAMIESPTRTTHREKRKNTHVVVVAVAAVESLCGIKRRLDYNFRFDDLNRFQPVGVRRQAVSKQFSSLFVISAREGFKREIYVLIVRTFENRAFYSRPVTIYKYSLANFRVYVVSYAFAEIVFFFLQ